MRILRTTVLPIALVFVIAGIASAAPIGPFTGSSSETFESFATGDPGSPISILGGTASLSTPSPFIYEPGVANFNIGIPSVPALVSDGAKGFGLNGSNQTATIVFDSAISAFGAYWGSGSPADGVELEFFDAGGVSVGTESFAYTRNGSYAGGDGVLEWHGWSFSAPISSLTFTGDFTVVDGMQSIPEPSSLLLAGLGIAGLGVAARRRRRATV